MSRQSATSDFNNAHINFVFPARNLQLCEQPQDPQQFWVQDRINIAQLSDENIQQEIEQVLERLNGNKCLQIVTNDVFDVLYSAIFYLQDVSLTIRKEIIQILETGLRNLLKYMDRTRVLDWAEQNFINSDDLASLAQEDPQLKTAIQIKNALSAYVYLITWYLSDYCKLKDTKEAALTKNKRKVAKKDRTVDQENVEREQNAIQLSSFKIIQLLLDGVLKKQVSLLWPNRKIEEDFVKSFLKTGFDMLQHSTTMIKLEDQKTLIFEMLQTCMSGYGGEIQYLMTQNIQKIIDLLYNQDNLAVPMAQFVALMVEKQGQKIAGDIIQDLTKQIFHTDSSHETLGIKNIAKFLSKLSKLSPKAVYGNISCLLGFFDCEAYLLRQSLIKILANTIQYVLNPRETQADANNMEQSQEVLKIYEQTKIKFFELLMKRFHDKSAFCRTKVLKVFTKMISENLIPQWLYIDLLKSVIGRLKDTTVQVRKTALKIFQDLIIVCGWIFGVDVSKGEKFQSIQSVIEQQKEAERDFNNARTLLAHSEQARNSLREKIMCQYPGADSAQLQQVFQSNKQFVDLEAKINREVQTVTDSENIKNTFQEYYKFLTLMDEAGKLLKQMLSSKTIQDTVEVIRCYKILHKFGLNFTHEGLRKMLSLVFSKDLQVVSQVIETYHSIYFSDASPQDKVKNLFVIMREVTLTDLICLEEMLAKLIKQEAFEKEVYSTLWLTYLQFGQKFKDLNANTPQEERKRVIADCKHEQRSSIQLLRMMGQSKIEILLDQRDKLFEYSLKFARYDTPDFTNFKEAVLAFQAILLHEIKENGSFESSLKDSERRHMFALMGRIVGTFGTSDLEWFCACESVLNCLFSLKSRNSHEYAKHFLHQIVSRLFRSRTAEEVENLQMLTQDELQTMESMPLRQDITDVHFAQLFFVIGHISIKMLTFVEQLEAALKVALSNSFKKQDTDQKDRNDESQGGERQKDGKQEDDLAQITGGKEAEVEQYTQQLAEITENQLVQEGLIGKFLSQILCVSNEALARYSDKESVLRAPTLCILERSAILALCKISCISPKICANNLDLLFRILKSNIEFGIKANVTITLADLFNRFPNQMNERTKDMFDLLHDRDIHVRQQGLMVITHLILNDMLKLKGEIVDVCMLLEDPDERIRDQVKLFLQELHSKGNHLIYNLFPKAITRLSKEFEHLTKEEFENIAKNLINYIKNDKQVETLVEKLCQKLKNSPLPIEWRNTAFCLTQLKMTEKILPKLLEYYDMYKERLLQSQEVKEYFLVIVTNAKKFMKPEMKPLIEELEIKVNLDENAQLQLREDNKYLNAQELQSKVKKQKKQKGPTNWSEMQPGQKLATPRESSQKQTRAQLEEQNLNVQMQQMKINQQAKKNKPQQKNPQFGKPAVPEKQDAEGDAIMLEDDDSDEGVEYDEEEDDY